MMTPTQATHARLAAEADRRALTARTTTASRLYRRLAAAHRTQALMAGRVK